MEVGRRIYILLTNFRQLRDLYRSYPHLVSSNNGLYLRYIIVYSCFSNVLFLLVRFDYSFCQSRGSQDYYRDWTRKKEKTSIICIRDESCRLSGGRFADNLRSMRIKEMYSTFQFIIFFSNNPKTFLKSHPSWKVQPLILVFGIKISEAQVASL